MKILLENGDISYINKVNQDLKDNRDIPLFINDANKTYLLEFEALDIAKANNFILNMMIQNPQTVKEIEEVLGIKVKAFTYDKSSQNINSLKKYLKDMLNTLENMEED